MVATRLSITVALLVLALPNVAASQDSPLWLRYPALSPDAQTILFEYKGDIWSVPAAGGNAVPMTLSESYQFAPVWSHDGRWVAFASDRFGQFDVFVMAATGGEARRLTLHSAREVPSSFTSDDRAILFSAARQDLATAGCAVADLNADRRPDVACIGTATANLKWYENRTNAGAR